MVNNEMSEDMLGETGDGSGDCTETSASSSDSQPKSESSPSAKEADEPASSADENVRLSPTSLFCSVPLNRDVQTIIDTFPKTEAEKAGKKTRKIPCLYCDRTFVADNLRQKHVERSHSIKQARRSSSRFQQSTATVSCLFCNKFTLTENKLNDLFQHLVTAHPTKYFGCLPCQERFASLTQLEEHDDHSHGIRREVKVQSTEEVSDMKTNSAITDSSVVKTRHKAKIKDDSEQSDEIRPVLRRGRQQILQKELKHKKIAIKSTKLGIKRSARLQTKVVPHKGKKRPKPKERLIDEPKSDKDKEVKVSSTENPYPTFDAFYRVKKITDHSIDNLRITSLTFNDVFDQAFYNRIKCNIRENLLNHLDGKLFKNEESESRISNFEKTQPEFPTSENYGCEISLNAATPVAASLLTAQFGDDPESQIEYGSKASKKKSTPKQDEVHYKYFTRRKYQASILESKENRDLSKLDMWTQLVIKRRQQKILKETKSDREKLDYKKGEEYRAKKQNQELNRVLDRRGPFEDLKEEASKKAALEGNFNQEAHSDVTFILDDILGNIFSKVIEDVEVKTELTDAEIPSYLNLRKASLSNDSYVDKSDKITLICSSQETENFEAPDISPKDKNALVELTGEWARSRLYICAACGVKMANIKLLIDHKNLIHPNVWCQHYEFVGNQGGFYKHLSIPGLGKMERIETNCTYKVWKRSEARVCTKCKKQCNSLGELHRHVLECGEDWSWMLVRKKCKYKPFGAKTRKKRRGLFKRIIHKDKPTDENREKKTYKKEGPRVKPSDADTIQRMLANLPAKRATRKIMSLKDGFPKIARKTNYKKKTPETLNKVVNIKSKKQNMQMRRDRGEILIQDTQTVVKGKRRLMKCNPVNNLRKSMRNLNKVISSAIIDNNSTLMVKRKLKNAIQKQRLTRRSQQSLEEPLLPKESEEEEVKKPSKKAAIKKKPVEELEEASGKEEESPVRKTRSTSSLPDLEEPKVESPAKKKNKFGKTLMRTLSLRRTEKPSTDNEKQTASVDTENTKNNGKRKSKLETLKNAVKKIRLVKENLRSQKQSGEVVGGHFLEDGASGTAAETVTPVLCSDKADGIEDKVETSEAVVVGVSVEPAEEVEEKVICDNSREETETAVSACDPVTEISEVCDDVPVKPEKVSAIPKTKLCKRNKGLNACIAMLTSKLQQKEVEDTPVDLSVAANEDSKIKEEVLDLSIPVIKVDEGRIAEITPETLEPVDQNKPQSEVSVEEALVPEKSPETLKTFSGVEAPVEEKENIVLEQKPVEQNSPKKEEVRLEKVVDIIKCFEDMNSKENINGHNKKTLRKPVKKLGGSKKKPGKTKLNLMSENVIPSVEEQLNTAILEEDNNEVQRDVGVRKLGQRRTLPKRNTKTKQSDLVETEKPIDVVNDTTITPKPESSKVADLPVKPEVKKLIKEPKLILDSNFKIQTPINFTEAKELKALIQPVFSFTNSKPSEVQNFANLLPPNILNFPNPKLTEPIIKPPILKDVFTFSQPKLPESKTHLILKAPVMKDIFSFNSEIKPPMIKTVLNLGEKPDLIKSPILKDVFSFPEPRTGDLMVAKLFNPLQKLNGLSKPRSQSFGVFDKSENKTLNTSLPNLQINQDEPDVLENKSFTKDKLNSDSEDEIPLAVLAKEVLQIPKPIPLQKECKSTVLQIPTIKTKENKPNVVLQIPSVKPKTGKKQNEDSGVELTPKDQTMVSEKDIIQSFADFIKQNSDVACPRSLFADAAEPELNTCITDLVTTKLQQKEKKKCRKKGKLKKQSPDDLEESFMEHKPLLDAGDGPRKKSKKKKSNGKLGAENHETSEDTVVVTKEIREVTNLSVEDKFIAKTCGGSFVPKTIEDQPLVGNIEDILLKKGDDIFIPKSSDKSEDDIPINKIENKNSFHQDVLIPETIKNRSLAEKIEINFFLKNTEETIVGRSLDKTPELGCLHKSTEGRPFTQRNEIKNSEETCLPNKSDDGFLSIKVDAPTFTQEIEHIHKNSDDGYLIHANEDRFPPETIEGRSLNKKIEYKRLPDIIQRNECEETPLTIPALIAETPEGNALSKPNEDTFQPTPIPIVFKKPEPIISKITIPKIHIIQKPEVIVNLDDPEKSRKSKKKDSASPRHRKCKKSEPIIDDSDEEILQLKFNKSKKHKNKEKQEETAKYTEIEESISTLKKKKDKSIIADQAETGIEEGKSIISDRDERSEIEDNTCISHPETAKPLEVEENVTISKKGKSIIANQEEVSDLEGSSTKPKKKKDKSMIVDPDKTLKSSVLEDGITALQEKKGKSIADQESTKASDIEEGPSKLLKKKDQSIIDVEDDVREGNIHNRDAIIPSTSMQNMETEEKSEEPQAKLTKLIIDKRKLINFEPRKSKGSRFVESNFIATHGDAMLQELVRTNKFLPKSKNKQIEDNILAKDCEETNEETSSLEKLRGRKQRNKKINIVDEPEGTAKIVQQKNYKEERNLDQNVFLGNVQELQLGVLKNVCNEEKFVKIRQQNMKNIDYNDSEETPKGSVKNVTNDEKVSKITAYKMKKLECNEEFNQDQDSSLANIEETPLEDSKSANHNENFLKIKQQKAKSISCNADLDVDQNSSLEKIEETLLEDSRNANIGEKVIKYNEQLDSSIEQPLVIPKISRSRKQKNKKINYNEEIGIFLQQSSNPDVDNQNFTNVEIPVLERTPSRGRKQKNKKVNYNEEAEDVSEKASAFKNTEETVQKLEEVPSKSSSKGRKQKNKKINYNEEPEVIEKLANIEDCTLNIERSINVDLQKLTSKGRKQKNKKINYIEEPEDFLQIDTESSSNLEDNHIISCSTNNEENNKTIDDIEDLSQLYSETSSTQISFFNTNIPETKDELTPKGRKQKNKKNNYIEEPEDFLQPHAETFSNNLIISPITNIEETTSDDPLILTQKGRKQKNKRISYIEEPEDFQQFDSEPLDLEDGDQINIEETTNGDFQKLALKRRKLKKISYIEEPEDLSQIKPGTLSTVDGTNPSIANNEGSTEGNLQILALRGRKQKNKKIDYHEESEDFEKKSSSDDNNLMNKETVSPLVQNMISFSRGRKEKNKKINYIEEPEDLPKLDVEKPSNTDLAEDTSEDTGIIELQNIRSLSRTRKQKNKKINYAEEIEDSEKPLNIDDNIQIISSIGNIEEIKNDELQNPKARKQKNKRINYIEEPEDFLQHNNEKPLIPFVETAIQELQKVIPLSKIKKQKNKNIEEPEDFPHFDIEKPADEDDNQTSSSITNPEETPKDLQTSEPLNVRPLSRSRKQKIKKINYNDQLEDFPQLESKIASRLDHSNPANIENTAQELHILSASSSRGRKQKSKKINYNEEIEDFLQKPLNVEDSNPFISNKNDELQKPAIRGRKQKNKKINYIENSLPIESEIQNEKNSFISTIEEDIKDKGAGQVPPRGRKQKNKKINYNEEDLLKLDCEELINNDALKSSRQKNKKINYGENISKPNQNYDVVEEEIVTKSKKQKSKTFKSGNFEEILNNKKMDYNDDLMQTACENFMKAKPNEIEDIEAKLKKQKAKKLKHTGEAKKFDPFEGSNFIRDNHLIQKGMEEVLPKGIPIADYEEVSSEEISPKVGNNETIVADLEEVMSTGGKPERMVSEYDEISKEIVIPKLGNNHRFEDVMTKGKKSEMMVTEYNNITLPKSRNMESVFTTYDEVSSEATRDIEFNKVSSKEVIQKQTDNDVSSKEKKNDKSTVDEYEGVSLEDVMSQEKQRESMVVEYDEVSLDEVVPKGRKNTDYNELQLKGKSNEYNKELTFEGRNNDRAVSEYNESSWELMSKGKRNEEVKINERTFATYDKISFGEELRKGGKNERVIAEYNEFSSDEIMTKERMPKERNSEEIIGQYNISLEERKKKSMFSAYDEVSSEEVRMIAEYDRISMGLLQTTPKERYYEKAVTEYEEVSLEEGRTNKTLFSGYNETSLVEFEKSTPKGRKQKSKKPRETVTCTESDPFEIDTGAFEFNEDVATNFENSQWKQKQNTTLNNFEDTQSKQKKLDNFETDINQQSNSVTNFEINKWQQKDFEDLTNRSTNSRLKDRELSEVTKKPSLDDSSDDGSDAEPLIKIIDKIAVATNKSGSPMKIRKVEDLKIIKQLTEESEYTELPLKSEDGTKLRHQTENLGESLKSEESTIILDNLEVRKDEEKFGVTIFNVEDETEDFSHQDVLYSSSKLEDSEGEDNVITIASDDDDDEEEEDEPITISDVSDTKNEESSIVSDNSKENHVINSGKPKPVDTTTSSIDESEEAFETPNTETSDLNDTILSNKINTKLKMKQPCKKKKTKGLKKKDRHSKTTDIYCEICDKKFVRSDSLIKHKRTLTHIAKLSEIEAREAEERAKKDEEGLGEEIQTSILVPSPFSLKTNNDTLKLADIISDVLNKPVPEDNIDAFSEMQETKRYKSLGERKSFDSDSIMFNPPKSTFTNHINMSNKLPDTTGTFLETQISLLENIIENKANFQYIDDISNKSDERCSSDMSLVSDIKQDDSNIISFSHNTSIVSSIIHSDTNFVKPSQYEEISEDTRNFDEQRARKALNRDEELFLECCSLLKSSSEVSDYSKKSAKTISMVSTYGLKPGEETGWLEHKNLIAKQKAFTNNQEYLSDNSRPDTPIGDNYDDFSNSNTIRTEWNSKMKEGEFEDISLDSLTNSENNSNFNSFGMSFNEGNSSAKQIEDEVKGRDAEEDKFDDLMDDDCLEIIDEDEDDDLDAVEISENIKTSTEPPQQPTVVYTVPLPKKSDGDSSTNDSKKIMTKGAMKIFEGLKVSIPTEELDMSEVLNCSPTTKRQDLEPSTEASKVDKVEIIENSQKNNLNRFGNKLGLKITKKRVKPRASQERKLEEENKVHDIYDFEETQDNTDLFIPNNLKSFRTQLAEKKVEDKEVESDLDSNNHYVDSFSVEAQSVSSFSTETESSLSMKKNTGVKNITKKKCVIMGRIFKNAFKAKTDEIKTNENVKLVEDYVMNAAADGKPVNEDRIKMTEQEMDLLFDKLLEENKGMGKGKVVEGESVVPQVKATGKGRPKGVKQKKRVRKQSQSSDDEFNLSKTPKKRTARKKVKDNGINLEQELKECMGVAGRKSQRKCTSGKQNVLVEDWSSDDSEFEAMLRQSIQQSKTTSKNKEKVKETPSVVEPISQAPPPEVVPVLEKRVQESKVAAAVETKIGEPISEEFLKEIVKDVNEVKPKPRRKSTARKEKEERLPKIKGTIESTLASNRRKRAAADTLYYWSSSSDDDSQNLIEVKSVRDEIDEDDDRPMQHGWIVGDSPKKLVTMLAQAKGKKIDTKCVKEQNKKRTTI